jgi:hypothetical protein
MLGFNRPPKTPEELEARISDKAARRAAKIAAKGKARTRLDEAREGHASTSLAVHTINWAGYLVFAAAVLIILGGYWYDLLFYAQQSDNPGIIAGLLVFAFVIRTVAAFGDVILHATKPESGRRFRWRLQLWKSIEELPPEEEDDALGLKSFAHKSEKGDGDRSWLRVLWVSSIVACSFATVSFFSAGHETRQAASQNISAQETTITSTKNARIAALEKQKTEAATARDTAVKAADKTIQGVKDETPNVSADDNITIRDANASKNQAAADYNAAAREINAQINAINSEEEAELKGVTTARVGAAPFLTVYSFLARLAGTAEFWAIAGALFFALLFELLCAKLLAIVSVVIKALKRIAKTIQMREAADEMHARIALERMRSNIELEGIRLRAAAAHERGMADIDLARREREVEKARAHADALREGVAWIDPDELLEETAALQRAENSVRIRKLRERAEKLLAGEVDPDAPEKPESETPPATETPETPEAETPSPSEEEGALPNGMTAEEFRIWKSNQAKKHYANGKDGLKIPVEDYLSTDRVAAE